MALSRVQGEDELYIGGLWALRRSDALKDRNITHVLSVVGFNPSSLKNFKDEPWHQYGSGFRHMTVDIDDVDDTNLLVELPQAVKFIHQGLQGQEAPTDPPSEHDAAAPAVDASSSPSAVAAAAEETVEAGLEGLKITDPPKTKGGVFVHCMAGKSRSAAVVVAYLLWRYPARFDTVTPSRPRKESAQEAVQAALDLVRCSRPMAEPNPGFMDQLRLWWEMECPSDVEGHHLYQRWAYQREVEENLAVGMAPSRLRFEDEHARPHSEDTSLSLRCKKCRRTLASSPFIIDHKSPSDPSSPTSPSSACPHHFIEPLSWMRGELEKSALNGRLLCPNARCGAAVGRYDWKGFKCTCGLWVTPAFSLQRARVDDVTKPAAGAPGSGSKQGLAMRMGIRMPPRAAPREGNL
ncbi:protein-tyrosine phosphatase-like protein [Stachybotrys elegans]|uniref:protein-tyrosine-phosphatase n=1 Tax=Stachybotrys elegans TaxID=80388 RepID=A0A8K0SN22_9HYPO|nr:protein-tyrosine phosphatase-like protein [Stachybotrys elegans]